jgi:hypothetical protein
VFRAKPVMRETERIELPSTSARMICARSALLNLFIVKLCVSALPTVWQSQADDLRESA